MLEKDEHRRNGFRHPTYLSSGADGKIDARTEGKNRRPDVDSPEVPPQLRCRNQGEIFRPS